MIAATLTSEIQGIIEALRSAGADRDAHLIECDLYACDNDALCLAALAAEANEILCPSTDCA